MQPGTRLGPYEILAPLGTGGMGEVYRARDPKLNRDVAIKILPEALAEDPVALARFEREAQAVAALSHPNILAIFDFGREGQTAYAVMELLEGETLRARLEHGALPARKAAELATQIAEGLAAAHEKGIVHRDLKPENIFVTHEGRAKILDFGLAKAVGVKGGTATAGAAGDSGAHVETSLAHTGPGTVLGTMGYMSPEQVRGEAVDHRSDLFSFGVVLYEMLTGRRAFQGATPADTMSAILKEDPPDLATTASGASLPPALQRIVQHCLEKKPAERFRDAHDLAFALQALSGSAVASGSLVAVTRNGWRPWLAGLGAVAVPTRRVRLAWTLLGAALMAALGAGLILSGVWPRARPSDSRPPAQTRPLRVSISHTEGGDVGAPAISPDGTRVAYGARGADGMPLLWVRDLASDEARALPGTEDAALPFWSPDSRDLGFFAGNSLKRVPAEGGPVQVVTKNGSGFGGAWAPDGTIVFNGNDFGLFRISVVPGSTATPLTIRPSGDWSHYWPSFLPDGRRFLFTAKLWTGAAESSAQGIYLGSLDSAVITPLLPDLSSAVYAPPGYLVFVRSGRLTAAPFDLATGRLTGSPAPIGGTVAVEPRRYLAAVSAAADGTLAVRPPPAVALDGGVGNASFDAELRLVDRAGTSSRVGIAQSFTAAMALRPDGRSVAASIVDPGTSTNDLWLVDLQSGARTRLTTTRGYTGNPVWWRDGTHLAYAYAPPGQLDDVYIKDLRTGKEEPLIESQAVLEHPVAWSHDGASMLVWTADDKGNTLARWSFGSHMLTPFAGSGWPWATFSPDDRYVAFTSQESGSTEISVTTFPDRLQTWSLAAKGDRVLSWSADGREILVATLSGQIVAYPVSMDGGFSAGQPTVLVRGVGFAAPYSTARRDHSRILIRVSPDAAKDKGEIRLLFGWQDTLRQGKR